MKTNCICLLTNLIFCYGHHLFELHSKSNTIFFCFIFFFPIIRSLQSCISVSLLTYKRNCWQPLFLCSLRRLHVCYRDQDTLSCAFFFYCISVSISSNVRFSSLENNNLDTLPLKKSIPLPKKKKLYQKLW